MTTTAPLQWGYQDDRNNRNHEAMNLPTHVETEHPTASEVRCATLAAELAARQLGIPIPRIRWFKPADEFEQLLAYRGELGRREAMYDEPSTLAGIVTRRHPGVIWLRAGLPTRTLAVTAAHECAHVRQHVDHPIDTHAQRLRVLQLIADGKDFFEEEAEMFEHQFDAR